MKTGPYPQMCRVWPCFLPNDPERASRSRSLAGLIQYDGQIPQLLTPPVAGGVSHHDLPVLYAPENDEMSAGGEMPLGHNGDNQLPITQSVQDALGLRRRTAFHIQAPCFRRIGDQGVVGTALAAPAAVLIGPFCHLNRVNNITCQPVLAFSKIRLLATPCLILMVLGVGSLTYTDPVELTPALLREFVSKLVVNAPDKSSGHRVQRIDVHYNFIREIDLSPEFSKYSKKTTA